MSRATFRNFLLLLGIVAASFLVMDRVLGLGLQALLKQSEFRFARLYRGGLEADIIVLGNSRAVNAFYAPEMNRLLEKDVFHLGYNGMSMEIAELLFLDYLEYNETPELLLLEVTNLNVSNELLKDLKLVSGMSKRLRDAMAEELPNVKAACDLTHLYRFNGDLFLRCLYYLGKSDQAWINSGQIDSGFAASYEPSTSEKNKNLYATEGANWEALLRIIVLCENEDIDLRMVATPYLPNFRRNLPNYETWVGAFKKALPASAAFYDFTDALDSVDHFADVLHINKKGGLNLLQEMLHHGVFNSVTNE